VTARAVSIGTDDGRLDAVLRAPEEGHGLVIFAQGRDGGRGDAVTDAFHRAGLATLLLDLGTDTDDVAVLAGRVAQAVDWARLYPQTRALPVGVFGASAGAPAALVAADRRSAAVRAVVSRGPRPDLADAALDRLTTPTLLIVGGLDQGAVELNRQSFERLRGPKELRIIPGAAHPLDEAGASTQVARHARDWFIDHLG
jgi:dienelactone hydrolase